MAAWLGEGTAVAHQVRDPPPNWAGFSVSFIPLVIEFCFPPRTHVSFSNALKGFFSLISHILHRLPRVERYYTTELRGVPVQAKTSMDQRRDLGPLWTPPNTDTHSSVLKVKVNLCLVFLHKKELRGFLEHITVPINTVCFYVLCRKAHVLLATHCIPRA